MQSCFVRHTSPSHRVRHRNFIFGTDMPIFLSYMYIKYLVILTCSFQMAAILVHFFDLLSFTCGQSQRLHIAYTYVYLLDLYTQKKECPVTFFLKFMSIFFRAFNPYALIQGPLRLSCVFLTNYIPDEHRSTWTYFCLNYMPIYDIM